MMKQSVDDRAAMLGEYIVQNKATVRRAAKQFGVSKSTVHKDVAERLGACALYDFTGLADAEKGAFLDELVMHEVLSELKEIAQRDGISCTCGSHRWKLQVNYSSIDLFCADCGAAMRIPAATASDIDDICCKTRLVIRGKKEG